MQYVKEEEARTSALNSSDITNPGPDIWPVATLLVTLGMGILFLSIKRHRQPSNC